MQSTSPTDPNPYVPLDIPELNISFKHFRCPSYEKFVASWKDNHNAHVYEVKIEPSAGHGWAGIGYTDGHEIFALYAEGKWRCRRMALAAMRASLTYTHRRTWRKRDENPTGEDTHEICEDTHED